MRIRFWSGHHSRRERHPSQNTLCMIGEVEPLKCLRSVLRSLLSASCASTRRGLCVLRRRFSYHIRKVPYSPDQPDEYDSPRGMPRNPGNCFEERERGPFCLSSPLAFRNFKNRWHEPGNPPSSAFRKVTRLLELGPFPSASVRFKFAPKSSFQKNSPKLYKSV